MMAMIIINKVRWVYLINRFHYETPIGRICIEDNGKAIIGLYLDDNIAKN